jgi:hypothetical protein
MIHRLRTLAIALGAAWFAGVCVWSATAAPSQVAYGAAALSCGMALVAAVRAGIELAEPAP